MLQGLELIDWRNKDEVIKFYEANRLYFDNYQIHSQVESIRSIVDVKLSYCEALISKSHFTKCLAILGHVNILIQSLEKAKADGYAQRHERYLFTEGVVFGYLKRYEDSQRNFKELVKIDPDNDLYKDWFEGNQVKIIGKQSNFIGFAGFAIVMLDLVSDTVLKIKLGLYVSVIGFIIMAVGFSLPYIIKRIKKMFKNPHA
jgi:hypothetical protein